MWDVCDDSTYFIFRRDGMIGIGSFGGNGGSEWVALPPRKAALGAVLIYGAGIRNPANHNKTREKTFSNIR
jgi:hypothetical protein